ncbi:hypothetical protein DCC62_11795 [candidate division KSB1 bacterium]|nr:MAG: hypothetical protein DCC62_11795 [candidate division KSB1 bacterium]
MVIPLNELTIDATLPSNLQTKPRRNLQKIFVIPLREKSDLFEELPHLWYDAYLKMTPRPTNVCRFTHGTFEYIFDDYGSLEAAGKAAYDRASESRLVAVLGRSNPIKRSRDDYRLRGWVGRTEESFGKEWDKGHFIAHSLGGAVDGIEANVFVQRRDLNRGWSARGKLFREMEKYCAQHPGTFCFNHPLYRDHSARPAFLEFGLLKNTKELWVERFDNR